MSPRLHIGSPSLSPVCLLPVSLSFYRLIRVCKQRAVFFGKITFRITSTVSLLRVHSSHRSGSFYNRFDATLTSICDVNWVSFTSHFWYTLSCSRRLVQCYSDVLLNRYKFRYCFLTHPSQCTWIRFFLA